jgi:hypothetical protein
MASVEEMYEKKVSPAASSSGVDAVAGLPLDDLSEHRLLRKLDWHILPLISVIHLLSFL